ncbi:hypothetical protein VIGAN_02302100, partial [Vigna angularis var. angularis]
SLKFIKSLFPKFIQESLNDFQYKILNKHSYQLTLCRYRNMQSQPLSICDCLTEIKNFEEVFISEVVGKHDSPPFLNQIYRFE